MIVLAMSRCTDRSRPVTRCVGGLVRECHTHFGDTLPEIRKQSFGAGVPKQSLGTRAKSPPETARRSARVHRNHPSRSYGTRQASSPTLRVSRISWRRRFDVRILRHDLERRFLFDSDKIDLFANYVERYVKCERPAAISGDALVLAVHRANVDAIEEVGLDRIIGDTIAIPPEFPAVPDLGAAGRDGDPELGSAFGPAAPVLLWARETAARLPRAEEAMASILIGAANLAAVAVAAALRNKASDIAGAAVERDLISADRTGVLVEVISANAGPAEPRKSFLKTMAHGIIALQETGGVATEAAFNDRLARGLAAGMAGSGIDNIPISYYEDPRFQYTYTIVSSTERRARQGAPLVESQEALRCYERVEIYDDIEGHEWTYQRDVAALETDDSPSQDRVFVPIQWKIDRKADLPPSHARLLEPSPDIAIYRWHMVERETTETVLDKLFEKAGKALEDNKDDLEEKAVEKVLDLLADFGAGFLPFPVPDGIKSQVSKLASKAVGELVGWLVELVVDLVDTSARPFPTVVIIHTIVHQPGQKPINLVILSTLSRDGGGWIRCTLPSSIPTPTRSSSTGRSIAVPAGVCSGSARASPRADCPRVSSIWWARCRARQRRSGGATHKRGWGP